MDLEQWAKEYKRLLTAFSKPTSSEQARLYFQELRGYPFGAVVTAVTGAIRDGKYWPTPAELIERARLSRPRETTHGAVCEACQGSTWVETPCDGVSHGEPQTRPSPVHRGRVCRTDDVMHAAHLMATRCPGCSLDLMPTHGDRA